MSVNNIKDQLISLDICQEDSIEEYHPRVRDRDGVSVLKCNNSGVIFLSTSSHVDASYYMEQEGFEYWSSKDRKRAIDSNIEDTIRRKNLVRSAVQNRKWIDIGTGAGGILDELEQFSAESFAVEPQRAPRKSLQESGYTVYKSIEDIPDNNYDVVTMFHVFEHLTSPLEDLKLVHSKMSTNGKIFIEVPHAKDFLISFLNLEEFKDFTFWSEHLILHTRQSLECFLRQAGFKDIVVKGCQRYPLANHLHWLSEKKPDGHNIWNHLRSEELDCAYSNMLNCTDSNDTLVATAVKR
jgi:2-polyprenyl-3-methyl-5-hydroxy-6-metoxy-1,4-benzoquinol methylase